MAAALLVAGGCARTPTTPSATQSTPVPITPATPPRTDGPFEVTGIVTDEQGMPVAGVEVTMGHYEGSWGGPGGTIWVTGLHRPATRTDGAGRYAITFSSDLLPTSHGPGAPAGDFLARAEIYADGYEWYSRNLFGRSVRDRVENFRLSRIRRIAAGESIAVSVSTDNGQCVSGWLPGPCARLRVTASSAGDLTIDAVPADNRAALPVVEACCFGGDDQYGNPVTLHVDAGSETVVEIGQNSFPVSFVAPTVLVKTSLKPD